MKIQFRHKYFFFILFFVISLFTYCGEKDKKNEKIPKNVKDRSNDTKQATNSFTAFLEAKSEVELLLHSAYQSDAFDLEESIKLSIEIYNPRLVTYQSYKNTLGADQLEPEFTSITLGNETDPWYKNLKLYSLSKGRERHLSFLIDEYSGQNALNLGEGDLGMLSIILEPGVFSEEGDKVLVMKYFDPEHKFETKGETVITLKRGVTDELQKNLSQINYLHVSDKRQEALELAIETANTWPESYRANVTLGNIYELNGQFTDAIASYRKGLSIFKVKRDSGIMEFPIGILDKINELESKIEN